MDVEQPLVVIMMGSTKDLPETEEIQNTLDRFDVSYTIRALSAHKLTDEVLEAVEEYDRSGRPIVYIVVAGRSNALGPTIAGNSAYPVINCPVLGSFDQDLFSSLRTPSSVPCSTILEGENAALHAVQILAFSKPELRKQLREYRGQVKEKLRGKDSELNSRTPPSEDA